MAVEVTCCFSLLAGTMSSPCSSVTSAGTVVRRHDSAPSSALDHNNVRRRPSAILKEAYGSQLDINCKILQIDRSEKISFI